MSTENTVLVRAAIVGCGAIGKTHATAIGAVPGIEVTAVVDGIPAAATALAQRIADSGAGRPAEFATLEQALASGEVDLVVIATPSGLHIQQGIESLAAGKHVIIEKPLDVDLSRARDILEAAEAAQRRGIVTSVISQHRFDPASRIVHQAVSEGRFGTLTSAIASVAWWRSQGYYDSGAWRGTWSMDGGGAVMNQGVHTVDLLLWMLGKPVAISAQTALLAHDGLEVEDTAVATVTFESGALAVLHATTAAYPGLTVRLQVMGSKGSAVIDDDELEYFHAHDAAGAQEESRMGLRAGGNQVDEVLSGYPRDTTASLDPTVYPAGHIRQYQDILEAIRDQREPGVTVRDAILALATVRALYISASLGRSVTIADVVDGKYDDVQVHTGPTRQDSNSQQEVPA